MNDFFLELGLSWTLSKIVPYLLFLLFGILLFMIFRKKMKSGIFRWLSYMIIVVPLIIYFAFNPIYEGDFSNSFNRHSAVSADLSISTNALTVIAIPNCPYCTEAIGRLNKLVNRTGTKNISVKVLSSDVNTIQTYKSIADERISISIDTNFRSFESITMGRFPTFVFRDESGIKTWSNDGFGVVAADWVESKLVQ